MTAATTSLAERAWEALATVDDPELGRPITELGFVLAATVLSTPAGTGVDVRLRLPTYFCAPNFAYLMVADAYDALVAVRGLDWAEVRLTDHFAAEEINAGVAARDGFADAFEGQAVGELDELRRTFRRKAHLACLERTCRKLLDDGWRIDALAHATLGEIPASAERDSLTRRRRELGLPASADTPLFVDESGAPIPEEQVEQRLRFAKTVRVSIDGNTGWCRGLLRTRYGDDTAAPEGTAQPAAAANPGGAETPRSAEKREVS
ncbi:Metal-sulfur cluster biosynthetic enzyme [Prauserella aidingensis]|uniref:iron-sulfur cluster assembly protein n=1 Tax=Prauserella aidingensis TaxID=387890 RepID=UPI0020A2EB14|nr:iron-sulfur cluster assembly protein [Prauserella aidingensis]MCP2252802.1 Metal-sulfur cluster biosynthetic enzyme [Prauserella aidingensis]